MTKSIDELSTLIWVCFFGLGYFCLSWVCFVKFFVLVSTTNSWVDFLLPKRNPTATSLNISYIWEPNMIKKCIRWLRKALKLWREAVFEVLDEIVGHESSYSYYLTNRRLSDWTQKVKFDLKSRFIRATSWWIEGTDQMFEVQYSWPPNDLPSNQTLNFLLREQIRSSY